MTILRNLIDILGNEEIDLIFLKRKRKSSKRGFRLIDETIVVNISIQNLKDFLEYRDSVLKIIK